jgi:hypothetical protein
MKELTIFGDLYQQMSVDIESGAERPATSRCDGELIQRLMVNDRSAAISHRGPRVSGPPPEIREPESFVHG